ncbi:cupin domain-containing protein [Xanthovirga aplysinae]|uniref:cupin domain-containing protein n=1 Tax=Xanthovirga aplysinae TaxID=2529853 RepID=UPI0012BCA688|nr:cupin domain-containing protein [Xanthovirga aplysinae]MTI33492.1 cupin domain-containing protein [Xanthovirga aplysinae]
MKTTSYWINKLELIPHPEGGYYRQNYRAKESIAKMALPERFTGDRRFSTAIYFLLDSKNFSSFHCIKQDEVWHFYEGRTLSIHVISPMGEYTKLLLGNNVEEGEEFQVVVEAGSWFAAEIASGEGYALVGCTVAPGFDFDDFELAKKEELSILFPQYSSIIEKLCRN